MFVTMACSMSFTACSDDDDENTGGDNLSNFIPGALFDNNSELPSGLRIKLLNINSGNFYLNTTLSCQYDTKGNLNSIIYKDNYGSNEKIYIDGGNKFIGLHDETYTLNPKGFIMSIDDGESTSKYTYNSKDQLIKYECDYIEAGKTGHEESVYTYSGNLLTKLEYKHFLSGDFSMSSVKAFNYDNAKENKFYQYPSILLDELGEGLDAGLAYLGYFGKSSSKYPTSVKHSISYKSLNDDYNDEDTYTFSLDYRINDDATLSKCESKDIPSEKDIEFYTVDISYGVVTK